MSCDKWWHRRCLRQFVYDVLYVRVHEVLYVNVYDIIRLQNVLVRYVCAIYSTAGISTVSARTQAHAHTCDTHRKQTQGI